MTFQAEPPGTLLTRRSTLLAAVSLLSSHAARAEKHIFLDYTQDELDRAYDQSRWAPTAAAIQARYGTDSASVRQAYAWRTESYGSNEAEALDIFAPGQPAAAAPEGSFAGAPILVFIHGGAWLRLTKDDASAPAPTFVDRGGIWVALNFANARQAPLMEMVEQCRRALAWVVRNAASFGGDPGRVFLAGHSSGAHLGGVLLTTDWAARGLPAAPVRGALLMSGIYDLRPALLSSRRNYLQATDADVAALSPMRHLHQVSCPVIVSWGDEESPEFKRQSRVFADALAGMGWLEARHLLFNTNHFEEPEQLNRPDTVLGRAALGMMGLG